MVDTQLCKLRDTWGALVLQVHLYHTREEQDFVHVAYIERNRGKRAWTNERPKRTWRLTSGIPMENWHNLLAREFALSRKTDHSKHERQKKKGGVWLPYNLYGMTVEKYPYPGAIVGLFGLMPTNGSKPVQFPCHTGHHTLPFAGV